MRNYDKDKATAKRWRDNNRDKVRKSHREYMAKWRAANPALVKASQDANLAKVRNDVFAHYGERCACCGESARIFLVIDHINGGGNVHRKTVAKSAGTSFYFWLRKHGFPDGFQTLCHNCNFAKTHGRICPHQADLSN